MNQKVFCIGFHKTGTSSLAIALKILGFNVCRRLGMIHDLLPNENVIDILKNQEHDKIIKAVSEFNGFIDNPWPLLFKEVDVSYPESKFILTVRDEKSWLNSVINYFKGYETQIRKLIYGKGSPIGNEEIYLNRYRQHNADVLEYFKDRPEDILVIDIEKEEKKWETLCKFLQLEIPSQKFPHNNKYSSSGFKKSKISRLNSFLRSPIQRKLLFVEAIFFLSISRALVVFLPFRLIAKQLGDHMKESSKESTPQQEIITATISNVISKASSFTPFRSLCFEQAITCTFMLNRRGVASTIYFGLTKDKAEKLKAHAWTRSGTSILTGAKGRHQFNVVSTFGSSKQS